ncbi:MAG: nicotinate phosphoribosyltransferase [Deltaproteobacteria bacterium]|nr:MAG: nicotinate phosphoribosyltransferase [Deltaproteobacteria bacterium]
MNKQISTHSPPDDTSLSLLTDLYQLTMAYGYWKLGMAERQAVFHAYFRNHPFNGGYCISCGLSPMVDYLNNWRFSESDLAYLSGLKGNDGNPLFEDGFIRYLSDISFSCDVDAVREGTPVFAGAPTVRIRGPLLQAQLVETAILNSVNFQTLIATKTARICRAAQGQPVYDFGLRRAQGADGGISASRACYIGGCDGTSNVLAGKRYGIPVRGTIAHSWVMAFGDERAAFDAYASVLPNNCVLLVDTYDTREGVENACRTGRRLEEMGHRFMGVRIDSGDLTYFSQEARKILDAGGFPHAKIAASSDLDEYLIESLKNQKAAIDIWGVGTRMVTAYDQPALNGVYKLSAIQNETGDWEPRIKVSEQLAKVTTPGILQVRRFYDGDRMVGDMIYDERSDVSGAVTMVDPLDATRQKHFSARVTHDDLLVPVFRKGEQIMAPELDLSVIRERCRIELNRLHPANLRITNPHTYPVGLESGLNEIRTHMIRTLRKHGVHGSSSYKE